jgi:hypothetical protein
MLKRLAIAALTLAAPAALLVATVAPANAAVASNSCNAVNFLGEYCGYYAGSATTAEFSTNTPAVKEIQDLIDKESNFPARSSRSTAASGHSRSRPSNGSSPTTISAVVWTALSARARGRISAADSRSSARTCEDGCPRPGLGCPRAWLRPGPGGRSAAREYTGVPECVSVVGRQCSAGDAGRASGGPPRPPPTWPAQCSGEQCSPEPGAGGLPPASPFSKAGRHCRLPNWWLTGRTLVAGAPCGGSGVGVCPS